MKKEQKNPEKLNLSELKKQIPQLKETKQGQLKGGFVSLKSASSLSAAFSNDSCSNINQFEGCTCK